MKNIKNIYTCLSLCISLLSSGFLASCASTNANTNKPEEKPLYINPEAYNWQVTGEGCTLTLKSKSADITLSTDGSLSAGKLMFRLQSDVLFEYIPHVILTHNNNFFPILEGANKSYSFEMPYKTAYEKSHLLGRESYIVISYTPKGSPYEISAAFETNVLAEHLAQVEELCYQNQDLGQMFRQ